MSSGQEGDQADQGGEGKEEFSKEVREEAGKLLVRVVSCNKCVKRIRRRMLAIKQRAVKDKKQKEEALQRKRDEAERKARRGEIDPTHEFTFLLIGQVLLLGFSNSDGTNYKLYCLDCWFAETRYNPVCPE